MADRWRECRRTIARHSRSFDLASRLFPGARRDEVAALYGWCRRCDDAIDLAAPSAQRSALEEQRALFEQVYADQPFADPVLACFQEMVRRRQIPIEYPLELLDGMAMDVAGVRYRAVDDVLVYCWRVAGAVGLMMCHIMGVSEPRAARHAAHLGIAMQLTNICRDVLEDWERGRLYVPTELLGPAFAAWMDAHPPPAGLKGLPETARRELAEAVQQLLALAERYYASADVGLSYLDPRSALAVRTARLVYAEIGREIEARGCDVTQGRSVVSRRRQLRLVARALRRFAAERRTWSHADLLAPRGILRCADAVRLA